MEIGPYKCGRTRSFLTGFQVRGDLSEGSLGGRLAQRLAALREVMAAGARLFACLPSLCSALPVPLIAKSKASKTKSQVHTTLGSSSIRLRLALSPLRLFRLWGLHRNLSLQGDRFLIIRTKVDGAGRVLPRFTHVPALEKNSAQEDVRVDQP